MNRRFFHGRAGTASGGIALLCALAAIICCGLQQHYGPLGFAGDFGGNARLIRIDPEPGEECQWEPASAKGPLTSLFEETAADEQKLSSPTSKRQPLRTIHDPYSAYSSVAVDTNNGEVVLTDENLFNILVYDRQANTPPSATMTEPKRMIGGLNTKIEFQCGLYIDPVNGDIYAVNNDTVDTLVIFSRQVRGDQPPTRQLETPHGTF